jgi:hypothetical protein
VDLDCFLQGIQRWVAPLPGEFLFFAPPKKSGPEGLVAKPLELTRPLRSLALRFSPVRVLAELAGFAAPSG